ncbi:MAG: peptidoglycan DD-metalloendopeptidase family protein [Candidatus Pacebacteria bacterium]|nr:peptidoglycan DD-metalloendopeptidase family protein [Candidatus Paceibacterota bacterium]MCF7863151.1 peptidoglycan DD-metalloendopeptidase family protein [Candidatus Paceibacterota bacterium]
MRHYQDYKNLFKTHSKFQKNILNKYIVRNLPVLYAIFLCFFLFTFAYFLNEANILQAQTAQEINTKIEQKNAEIEKLERDIRRYQAEIDTLGKEKNSLNNAIKQIDLSRQKLNTDISVTEKKIERTNFTLKELGTDILDKEGLIKNNMASLASQVRRTNEIDLENPIKILISGKNFTELWNDVDNMASVKEALIQYTSDIREAKFVLEDTREKTNKVKNELVGLKTELANQKKVVDQNASDKKRLLAQTKNNESNYQKLLKDQITKKELFEKELRDYESQLKFILDPKKLPNRGVLSWPLDYMYVTQEFGAKTGPHRTYASGHSGTDFRARTPVPTKAMADGVVKGVGDTDIACPGASFGRWVFIEYNNGLSSTHAHLSTILAYEGQQVKRGQTIAYTGGTGRVTGPHLHISLYVSSGVEVATVPSKACPGKILKQPIAAINAYLDPMYYLPAI